MPRELGPKYFWRLKRPKSKTILKNKRPYLLLSSWAQALQVWNWREPLQSWPIGLLPEIFAILIPTRRESFWLKLAREFWRHSRRFFQRKPKNRSSNWELKFESMQRSNT